MKRRNSSTDENDAGARVSMDCEQLGVLETHTATPQLIRSSTPAATERFLPGDPLVNRPSERAGYFIAGVFQAARYPSTRHPKHC